VISSLGSITAAGFTPANVDERDACPALIENLRGLLLGDKGFIRPSLKEKLAEQGLYLQTPLRENMEEKRSVQFLRWMMSKRRLIETVIGQLSERFHIENKSSRHMASDVPLLEENLSPQCMCENKPYPWKRAFAIRKTHKRFLKVAHGA